MALSANEVIEQNLYAYVVADATVSGLIGTRFYPVVAPQNPPKHPTTRAVLPYGVFRRISTVREPTHDGASGIAHPRFQVDWMGSQAADGTFDIEVALDVADEFRKLLDGFQGTMTSINVDDIKFIDDGDIVTPDFRYVGRRQDFIIWHTEATS